MAIIICHIKTNMPVFQQIKHYCHTKIGQICSPKQANKNCHIKIAHVEGL